jgi:hypothetical protein
MPQRTCNASLSGRRVTARSTPRASLRRRRAAPDRDARPARARPGLRRALVRCRLSKAADSFRALTKPGPVNPDSRLAGPPGGRCRRARSTSL